MRGDVARLGRCVSIVTGKDSQLPRCKPFKYTYEKEIVMFVSPSCCHAMVWGGV